MGLYDCLVGELKCGRCGGTSVEYMQTKISPDRYQREFRVGHFIEIGDCESVAGKLGSICLNFPEDPCVFSHLAHWACDHCHYPYNWALIKFNNGIFSSFDSVELNDDIVKHVNYVTDEANFTFTNDQGVTHQSMGWSGRADFWSLAPGMYRVNYQDPDGRLYFLGEVELEEPD